MTGTATATDPKVLYLSIDLGRSPALADIDQCVRGMLGIWEFVVRNPPPELLPHTRMMPKRPMRQVPFTRTVTVDDQRSLVVRRMSLASPWEVVLGTLVNHSTPLVYGAAGLLAVERIIRLIMDWQRHRAALADLSNDERHREAHEIIASLHPSDLVEVDSRRFGMLMMYRIVKVELQPDEDHDTQ